MRLSHRLTKQGVRWSYRDTIYWSHETDTPDSIFDSKMKINSKTALRYLVIFLAFGVKEIAGVAVTTFSCDQKAAPKESFNITCSITGTIVSGIQWIRPDGTQVITCSDPTTCGTLVSGYSITSASSSENVLQIANMGALDGGNWTCQDGPGGDKGCEIIVQKTPTFTLTIILEKKKYSVGDTLEVSVDVQDYYCSRTPSFHLLLDTQRVELDALPSTTSTTLSGTQNKSITVTEEMTGSIKLVFNCRDDDVFANKTFTIMDPTPATTETPTTDTSQSTDSSTSQTTSDSSSSTTSVENTTAQPTSDTFSSTTSVENTTAQPTSDTFSSTTSVENEITEASDESPFACESNCVEETRRLYLSVFLPVLILVAIDVVVLVSVVCNNRRQNKTA